MIETPEVARTTSGSSAIEFCRMGAKTFGIAIAPAIIDLQVSSDRPTQFLQALRERFSTTLHLGIVRTGIREYADAPHPFLRVRRSRPRRFRAAEQAYELPPPHVLSQPQDCSLPQLDRKYRVVHHSKLGRPMSQLGQWLQVWPISRVYQCPLSIQCRP